MEEFGKERGTSWASLDGDCSFVGRELQRRGTKAISGPFFPFSLFLYLLCVLMDPGV